MPIDAASAVPAAAGGKITGSLQCTTNIADVTPSYPLQCRAVGPPPDLVLRRSFEPGEGGR